MDVSWVTDQGSPNRRNEGFVAAAPGAVVVLDGCGLPLGTDLGCAHGTAWYSRSLGIRLLARLLDSTSEAPAAPPLPSPPPGPRTGPPSGPPEGIYRPSARPLVGRLAGAIADVAASHRHTCDLSSPATPAATVLALRLSGDLVDYLVLADSTLLLDGVGGLAEVTGGHFYAAADPGVADLAITGTVPLTGLRRALLLTDGATRTADLFGDLDWAGLAALVEERGPAALIERTRELEQTDPYCEHWPRSKPQDDATVAVCRFTTAVT